MSELLGNIELKSKSKHEPQHLITHEGFAEFSNNRKYLAVKLIPVCLDHLHLLIKPREFNNSTKSKKSINPLIYLRSFPSEHIVLVRWADKHFTPTIELANLGGHSD